LNNYSHLTGLFKILVMGKRAKYGLLLSLRMEQSIKENGSLMIAKKMAAEFKFGQMGPDMMDFGEMAWPMDMEDLSMLKEMCMKASGLKTRQMALEFILILTEAGMKDNGIKINSMDTVLNNGLMVQNMKEIMKKE